MIRKTSLLRDRTDVLCGQAIGRQASHAMFIEECFHSRCALRFDAGDCAPHGISSRPNARSDLFFTMSDNPPRRIFRCRRGENINFRTSRSMAWRNSRDPAGGARRDRTDDLLLAKQALSQLSYGPFRDQRSEISHQKSARRLMPDF